MQSVHHLKLFGVPQLVAPDNTPVSLRTKKQLGLLIYLALEGRGRPLAREKLADLFWPDVSEQRARHSLCQALTAIRQRLGRDAVSRSRGSVCLQAEITTDLDSPMQRDLDPTDLARPLEGLGDDAEAPFAHWLDAARERCIRRLRTQLLAGLTDARMAGDLERVHKAARILYGADPLSDTAALALAEQYLLDGDTTGAVAFLGQHIQNHGGEGPRRPSPDVVLLQGRLQGGFLSKQPLTDFPQLAHRPTLRQRNVFVGRESELARLEASWASARSGGLETCLISGAGGLGKSALLRRFATSVTARAWPAFVVECQEMGRSIPFAAISDLICQLVRDPASSGTNPDSLAEASRVTPGLRAVYPGIPDPKRIPSEAMRIRVADAIHDMVLSVARGGSVLLALDHIQNIDPASREVLHLLTRMLVDSQTMLLATTGEGYSEYVPAIAESGAGVEWLETIELGPLSRTQVGNLVSALLSEGEDLEQGVIDNVVKFSQGYPYLTELLLSDWKINSADSFVALKTAGRNTDDGCWSPPQALRRAFERQYFGLETEAQHLVHLLAVGGRSISVSDLEALLGVDSPTLDQAALELIRRSIVRMDGEALGYKSALHRASVYRGMPREKRRYYHTRLARFLAHSEEEQDFQAALEASYHYLKAEMSKDAVMSVMRGAELAITHGAPAEAERALKAVVENDSCVAMKPELTVLLAAALSAQQSYGRSRATLVCSTVKKCEPRYRAMATYLEAEALHRGGLYEPDRTACVAQHAVALASAVRDEKLALEAEQIVAETAFEQGDWERLAEVERDCSEISERSSNSEDLALAFLTQGYCRLVAGDFERAADKIARSCELLEDLRFHAKLHMALNGLGICYTNLGLIPKAIARLQQAMSVAARCGDAVSHANSCANLGSLYFELGFFAEAAEHFCRALSLDLTQSNSRVSAAIRCNAANLAIALGSFREAELLIRDAQAAAESSQLWQHRVSVLLTWADLNLALGQPDLAWPRVQQALGMAGDCHGSIPDAGQYWRLWHHYEAASDATSACRPAVADWSPVTVQRLAHRLEICAFDEWLGRYCKVDGSLERTAVEQLVDHRLFGVVARLRAVHALPNLLPAGRRCDSAAELVARAYPTHLPENVPRSLGLMGLGGDDDY